MATDAYPEAISYARTQLGWQVFSAGLLLGTAMAGLPVLADDSTVQVIIPSVNVGHRALIKITGLLPEGHYNITLDCGANGAVLTDYVEGTDHEMLPCPAYKAAGTYPIKLTVNGVDMATSIQVARGFVVTGNTVAPPVSAAAAAAPDFTIATDTTSSATSGGSAGAGLFSSAAGRSGGTGGGGVSGGSSSGGGSIISSAPTPTTSHAPSPTSTSNNASSNSSNSLRLSPKPTPSPRPTPSPTSSTLTPTPVPTPTPTPNPTPTPTPESSPTPCSATSLPLAPTNLSAVATSPSEINLVWNPTTSHNDCSVVVERATGNVFQTLVTLNGGEAIYTDTSGWASATYAYRVKACNNIGCSAYSNQSLATTQAVPAGAMAIVSNLRAVADSPTSATITFTDTNTSVSARGYFVERSDNGIAYHTVADMGTGTSFYDTGLVPGATYNYRVYGGSFSAPTSNYTSPVSVTVPALAGGAPVPPSKLAVVDKSSTSVTVTWKNNDSSQIKLERAPMNPWVATHAMSWAQVALLSPGTTSFTDTGLTPEHSYAYRVSAVNGNGQSDFAAPASDVMHGIFGDAVGVVMASAGTGSPKTYDIGPGQPYLTIASLDWTKVGPGDTVNIHYKPGGYHELFMISTRGTPTAWITVQGIPDGSGNLPTIDGTNAVLNPQFTDHYAPIDGSGCLMIGTRAGYVSGYNPGYLLVKDLEFANCYSANSFTDSDGSVKNYGPVGGGIYLERADHVTLQNNIVDGNGEGIFGAGQPGFDRLMTNITLDGNYIYNNGNIGRFTEHSTYMEGIDTVYQYNHYGPLRAGALGASLKDRSAGTIIRYNYIEGGAVSLQLPESQNEEKLSMVLPRYHTLYAYGNSLLPSPNSGGVPIWFGGDQGFLPTYRKGVLYLYNNTIVMQNDNSKVWAEMPFEMASRGESIDARNNIIAALPGTSGAPSLLGLIYVRGDSSYSGNIYIGSNWISHGYYMTKPGTTFVGNDNGVSNLLVGTSDDPGFINALGSDFRIAGCSRAVDASGYLTSNESTWHPLTMEYLSPTSGQARTLVGSAMDLGAFEYGTYGSYPGTCN